MYDNPIVSPHIKPGPILWVNCQVVTMHLNHGDDYNYSKDGTSFPRVLGSLLTNEARLMTEEGTIRT